MICKPRPRICRALTVMDQIHDRFRHRVAVRPRDKLFGSRGLLTSTNSPSVDIDYHKSTQKVFAEFAASNILGMRDLSLVTLAEPYHWSGATWSVDRENMTSSDWKEYSPWIS